MRARLSPVAADRAASSASVQVQQPLLICHCCAGLYYGAEAHLVANMSVDGKYHTIVFGRRQASPDPPWSANYTVIDLYRASTAFAVSYVAQTLNDCTL